MPIKKHFFTREKKTLKQPTKHIGNKSVKPRESVRLATLAQDKKDLPKLKKQELPKISQTITETAKRAISWKQIALGGFFLAILVLSVWQTIGVLEKSLVLKNVVNERKTLSANMQLWENIAQKYPGYRDAYFQTAILAYQLGDSAKEKIYLERTLQIDPNYQPAKELAAKQ